MGQATGESDTMEEAIAVLTANLSARVAISSLEGGPLVPKSTQNSGKHWTPNEVSELRDLARHNTPTRVIGLKLGRTPDAVQSKASVTFQPARGSGTSKAGRVAVMARRGRRAPSWSSHDVMSETEMSSNWAHDPSSFQASAAMSPAAT